jgi:hypothetical protein
MQVLTDNCQHSQAATLNENRWPFWENDRPFWREYAGIKYKRISKTTEKNPLAIFSISYSVSFTDLL